LFVFATDQPVEVDPLDTRSHKAVLRAQFGPVRGGSVHVFSTLSIPATMCIWIE
jgi:hypothetical protein